jgi:iron complex transport system substrate-binding protein
VVVLAACGGGSVTATSTAATSVSEETEFPVEVEHALGTTTIDSEPERVVTVGVTEQDAVLALGITPVGVTDWYGDQPYATWPWAQDELGASQPTVLTTGDTIDYEAVAALEPDVIIGTNAGLDNESFELLSEIAPTIAHPVATQPYFSPWADQTRLIGHALGRGEQMEEIITDVESSFAEAAAAHPEFEGTPIVFLQNAFYDGFAIAYQNGLSTEFLTDLGFVIPTEIDDFEREGEQAYIPLENLSVLDAADVLLWATEKPEDRVALEGEPLFRDLEEVEAGRLVYTDGITAGAIYFTSVLSLPHVVEHLVPALAETLAGNGPSEVQSS